jgi:hypothetical protein
MKLALETDYTTARKSARLLGVLMATLGVLLVLSQISNAIFAGGRVPEPAETQKWLGVIAFCVAVQIALGIGIYQCRRWAWWISMVSAFLSLLWFPVGTLTGFFQICWMLFIRPAVFEQPESAPRITSKVAFPRR